MHLIENSSLLAIKSKWMAHARSCCFGWSKGSGNIPWVVETLEIPTFLRCVRSRSRWHMRCVRSRSRWLSTHMWNIFPDFVQLIIKCRLDVSTISFSWNWGIRIFLESVMEYKLDFRRCKGNFSCCVFVSCKNGSICQAAGLGIEHRKQLSCKTSAAHNCGPCVINHFSWQMRVGFSIGIHVDWKGIDIRHFCRSTARWTWCNWQNLSAWNPEIAVTIHKSNSLIERKSSPYTLFTCFKI